MRKLSLRIIIAVITLIISVGSSWLLHRLLQRKPAPLEPAPCATPTPTPGAVSVSDEEEDVEYPDDLDISPWNISWFIDNNPHAKLQKLWTRLHVKDGDTPYSYFSKCDDCTTKLDSYDLDSEPGDEVVLKISNRLGESYRYLVFKAFSDSPDSWHLIGHVDEWGKYKESQNLAVLSGGRMWLVTQGQSASGSGVAFYHNRVFSVFRNRLKEVASYESKGSQSGDNGCPQRISLLEFLISNLHKARRASKSNST